MTQERAGFGVSLESRMCNPGPDSLIAPKVSFPMAPVNVQYGNRSPTGPAEHLPQPLGNAAAVVG